MSFVFSLLGALAFLGIAIYITIMAVQDHRAGVKEPGYPPAIIFALVLGLICLCWGVFGWSFTAAWTWPLGLTLLSISIFDYVRNQRRRRKQDARVHTRAKLWFYLRIVQVVVAIELLLLNTPVLNFGRLVVGSLALCTLMVGVHRHHRGKTNSDEKKKTGNEDLRRMYFRTPGAVIFCTGLVMAYLFCLMFPAGNPSAWWGWTLVAAIVLATWLFVADMLGGKYETTGKGWKHWTNKWFRILAWVLLIGLIFMAIMSFKPTVVAETNATPSSLWDQDPCRNEFVLPPGGYEIDDMTSEEIYESLTPKGLASSDTDVFLGMLEQLDADQRNIIESRLTEQNELRSDDQPELKLDIETVEANPGLLNTKGCLSRTAQMILKIIEEEYGRSWIDEAVTAHLDSRE